MRHAIQRLAVCLVISTGIVGPAATEFAAVVMVESKAAKTGRQQSVDSISSKAEMAVRIEELNRSREEGQPELGIRLPRTELHLRSVVSFVDEAALSKRISGEVPGRFTRTFEELAFQTGEPWPGSATATDERGVSPLQGRSVEFSRSDAAWRATRSGDDRPLSSLWRESLRADREIVDQPVLDWLAPSEAGMIDAGRLRSLLAVGGDYGFDARSWKTTMPEALDTASVEEGRGRATEKAFELAVWACLATGEYTGEASVADKECDRSSCGGRGRTCLEVAFEVELRGDHHSRLLELHSWVKSTEPSEEIPKIPGMRTLTTQLEFEGVVHIIVSADRGLLESAQVEAELRGAVQMDNYTSLLGYEWDGGVTQLSFGGQFGQELMVGRN